MPVWFRQLNPDQTGPSGDANFVSIAMVLFLGIKVAGILNRKVLKGINMRPAFKLVSRPASFWTTLFGNRTVRFLPGSFHITEAELQTSHGNEVNGFRRIFHGLGLKGALWRA